MYRPVVLAAVAGLAWASPATAQQLRISGADCAALLSAPADLPAWREPVLVPLTIELAGRVGVPRGATVDLPAGALIGGGASGPPPEVMAAIRRACAERGSVLRGSGTRDVLRGNR